MSLPLDDGDEERISIAMCKLHEMIKSSATRLDTIWLAMFVANKDSDEFMGVLQIPTHSIGNLWKPEHFLSSDLSHAHWPFVVEVFTSLSYKGCLSLQDMYSPPEIDNEEAANFLSMMPEAQLKPNDSVQVTWELGAIRVSGRSETL